MKLGDLFASLSGRRRADDEGEEPARFTAPHSPVARSAAQTHPYHAVSVVPGMMSCPKARKVRGIRFLSRAAPPIPLPGCTMTGDCACRFVKHNDRRQGDRRLFGCDPDTRFYSGSERRRTFGRRATDPRPQAS